MKTHESEEMYLETILLLRTRMQSVRSVDIVEELGYAKSSVSRAVNLLLKQGYIVIYEKHRVFTEIFVRMGAPRPLAEENACRMEHVISDDLFAILKKNLEK